jgi:thiamine biosynthesis lipoprotein
MRKVELIMGMPITLDIPDCNDNDVFDAVFNRLREIDRQYSPYKKDSELTRYQNGELKEKEISAEFKNIIKACQEAERITDGYFSAYFNGKFDPTGYVKGWAGAEAGKVIEKAGYKTYCIGAGGDILARSNSDKVWSIGIQDPKNKSSIIESIADKNVAVATSGNYERGKHIINPKTGKYAGKLLSVSVIGPDIITADVLATAIFARESDASSFSKLMVNYKALLIYA